MQRSILGPKIFRPPLQESLARHGSVKMAFMGEDSWKSGLSPLQLNKINALEKQRDALDKELTKKSYNFDILQQAHDKEKRKVSS